MISGWLFDKDQITEYTWLTSSICSKVKGGRSDCKDLASIVFPDHGGPVIRILCIQAAAIVSALFAIICPFISSSCTVNQDDETNHKDL